MTSPVRPAQPPAPTRRERTGAARRFGGLSGLGLAALVLGAVPFAVLTELVRDHWAPLQGVDDAVAQGLNDVFASEGLAVRALGIVTELGGGATASYILAVAVIWMLIRRQWRIATFLTVTGVGLAVLVPVTKLLVGRHRPEVLFPVTALPTNPSFPSGHSMTALVTWGAIALVVLPVVRSARRPFVVAATTALVLLTGFARLALGVHYLSDVIAGWALGAAWLAVTTLAFHRTLADRHLRQVDVGLGTAPVRALQARTVDESALPDGRRTVGRIGLLALATAALITGLGLVVTRWLADTAVGELDHATVHALLRLRTPTATAVFETADRAAGLWGVVTATVAIAALAVAWRGSWRPAAFVLIAVAGEVALYGVASTVVGRDRPDVPDLTQGLPTAASFPSGHVAAGTVVYGSLAAILIAYRRGRSRWLALGGAALVVGAVMVGRLYVAAHYPTDVLAGLLLGTLWVWGLYRLVLAPDGGRTSTVRWDAPHGRPSAHPSTSRVPDDDGHRPCERGEPWASPRS